jgi:hypothetical protein
VEEEELVLYLKPIKKLIYNSDMASLFLQVKESSIDVGNYY